MGNSLFNGFTPLEQEAIALSEGIICVCSSPSQVCQIIKSHVEFLKDVMKIPTEEISLHRDIQGGYIRYQILNIDELEGYDSFDRIVFQNYQNMRNVYLVGSSSSWSRVVENRTIRMPVAHQIRPNIAIDCTEQPSQFVYNTEQEIKTARETLATLIADMQKRKVHEDCEKRKRIGQIINSLAIRRPPRIVYAIGVMYSYLMDAPRMFRNTKNVRFLNNPPTDAEAENASLILILCNAGSDEAMAQLSLYVEDSEFLDKTHVILYSFSGRRSITEAKMNRLEVSYEIIIGDLVAILSGNSIVMKESIKRQIVNAIDKFL